MTTLKNKLIEDGYEEMEGIDKIWWRGLRRSQKTKLIKDRKVVCYTHYITGRGGKWWYFMDLGRGE